MTCSNNTKRNPWLDNLKAFAIYLVIAGHVLANCMPNGGYTARGIISFVHIPLFLVISGFLVKDSQVVAKKFWRTLLRRFVLPYTVWTVILTTFYRGVGHLLHDGIKANAEVYLSNWGHAFLWFIKAYLVTYILWQMLQKLSCWWRLVVGSILLIGMNLLVLNSKPLAEVASLSLYTYTLFGIGACAKSHIDKLNRYKIAALFVGFLLCLPFATPNNDYFECSFSHMLKYGDWYIFLIRMIAGTCISVALIGCECVCQGQDTLQWKCRMVQGVGQRTLQIYMLQSLLVEGALNRVIRLNDDALGIMLVFGVALVMTWLCYVIIQYSQKLKLCRILLWGNK